MMTLKIWLWQSNKIKELEIDYEEHVICTWKVKGRSWYFQEPQGGGQITYGIGWHDWNISRRIYVVTTKFHVYYLFHLLMLIHD